MNYINNRGPIITVQDPLRPGRYVQYRDLNWQGMPEIISFTDYLRRNYTLDYGSFIRKLHERNELPLSYNISAKSKVTNVTIVDGKYDRIDSFSFIMYVICDVGFSCAGYECHQQYCVSGYFRTYGSSDFLNDVKLYNGERIRCRNPLDRFLVPIMSKHAFDVVADEILDQYYDKERDYIHKINGIALAKAMGYDIQYLRLSLSGKIKSKLIFDKKDVAVYDKDGHKVVMHIPANTILVDKSLIDSPELDYVIIHECVHVRLHYLFYYIQSLYRRGNGKEMPEFLDYFYSETQKDCIRWMETQANSIARRIQMPKGDTTDVILEFMNHHDEMSFDDCRELIDHVKNKFGVSRYAAKKRIITWLDRSPRRICLLHHRICGGS